MLRHISAPRPAGPPADTCDGLRPSLACPGGTAGWRTRSGPGTLPLSAGLGRVRAAGSRGSGGQGCEAGRAAEQAGDGCQTRFAAASGDEGDPEGPAAGGEGVRAPRGR